MSEFVPQPAPPPIGQLFVDQGHVTPEQLGDALLEQQETGERLGEILVSRGQISRIDLASAIGDQWHWQPAEEQEAPPPAPAQTFTPTEPEAVVLAPEPPAPAPAPAPAPVSVAEERVAALEATVAWLVARLEETGRELEALRNASITQQAQLAAAARALVS